MPELPKVAPHKEEPLCHDPCQHEDMIDPLVQRQVAADRLAAQTAELMGEHPKVSCHDPCQHMYMIDPLAQRQVAANWQPTLRS